MLLLERMDGGRFHTVHSQPGRNSSIKQKTNHHKGVQGQDLDTLHAIGLALSAGPSRWTAMEGDIQYLKMATSRRYRSKRWRLATG